MTIKEKLNVLIVMTVVAIIIDFLNSCTGDANAPVIGNYNPNEYEGVPPEECRIQTPETKKNNDGCIHYKYPKN